MRRTTTAEVRPDPARATRLSASPRSTGGFDHPARAAGDLPLLKTPEG